MPTNPSPASPSVSPIAEAPEATPQERNPKDVRAGFYRVRDAMQAMDLPAMRAIVDEASEKLSALCNGERWHMAIPVQATDTDMVLGRAIDLAEKLIDDLAERITEADSASLAQRSDDRLADVPSGEARGIYVASRSYHGDIWKGYRSMGAPIVSTWIDECGQGETSDWSDLWRRCIDEATSSACVVLYAPILDGELKGALIETGAALAAGRRVFVVADVEARRYSWTAHPLVTVCESIAEAMELATECARSVPLSGASDTTSEEADANCDCAACISQQALKRYRAKHPSPSILQKDTTDHE